MLEGIQSGIREAVALIVRWVPLFLAFLAILVIGYFVAKLIAKAVDKVLERVGFDRLVERGGIKTALSRSKYDASTLLSKVVYYAAMLFVLQLAFGVFGPNPVSTMLNSIISYLPSVFVAGLIIVIGAAIAVGVRELVVAAMGGLSYGRTTATVLSAAIMIVAVFAALDQLQIAPAIVTGLFYAGLAAIAGAFIVAVGGGGIQTMRQYWERGASRLEIEAPRIREETRQAPERVEEAVKTRTEQMRGAVR